ncbi:uncharacterized protein K460DRAFT_415058 [Cucurbitaria berberidis CBS 394.84]|uniref:Uncharacterized protein n=1 Tax=Cucurbitaria berberidis CBS 394.84 TaxID=1168544 RepID=A0A9P4LBG9_9PLEO|nr:uncharacterized protein K460DRAFT_415058 [Cucurbitaria berberidis CBS 394.84]KAF1848513.1 hypothetical protein K460DRAFT_415058 [Cucurbitaria berberidis CBS 394.84]
MSDNEGNKAGAGKGWTDRQRLAYYFNLVEFTKVKLDFANAPRPDGKSVGACRIMVDRLKNTLKDELMVLRAGQPMEDGTPKKAAGMPRKRKAKGDDDESNSTPAKRGRKKKVEVEVETEVGDDDYEQQFQVKAEPRDEE